MKRLLIIEDQAEIRRLIRWALKPTQMEIREAASGQAGLDAVRDFRPDLVLLDIRMPGNMDGYEVCRKIRSSETDSTLPVLMLSADAFDNDREAAKQSGATSFLAKPFSPAELMKTVVAMLASTAAVSGKVVA